MNKPKTGKLFGVSLGPGDPGLITRRAWDTLHQGAHWTYPVRKKGDDSYALDIVLRGGLALPQASTPLVFPMIHDREILAKYWLLAAEAVLQILHAGQDVAFLVEGDASSYSTFSHLARTVIGLDDSVAIDVIPGVPSYNAAAARLQTPLAETDDTLAIIPAGYGIDVIERMLEECDTLALLKVKPMLDAIIDFLDSRGLLQHSLFIEKAGTPEERIVRDVASLRGTKVNYLSLMLVKNPDRPRGDLIRGCRKKSAQSVEETA